LYHGKIKYALKIWNKLTVFVKKGCNIGKIRGVLSRVGIVRELGSALDGLLPKSLYGNDFLA
jgi:hypothetical protein